MGTEKTIQDRLQEVVNTLDARGHNIGSINQLFVQAGYSRQHASAYSRGVREPNEKTLKKICEHYGINANYLVSGKTPVLLEDDRLIEEDREPYGRHRPKDEIVAELRERIEVLQKFNARLEQSLDDKEKIIRMIEKYCMEGVQKVGQ